MHAVPHQHQRLSHSKTACCAVTHIVPQIPTSHSAINSSHPLCLSEIAQLHAAEQVKTTCRPTLQILYHLLCAHMPAALYPLQNRRTQALLVSPLGLEHNTCNHLPTDRSRNQGMPVRMAPRPSQLWSLGCPDCCTGTLNSWVHRAGSVRAHGHAHRHERALRRHQVVVAPAGLPRRTRRVLPPHRALALAHLRRHVLHHSVFKQDAAPDARI